MTGTLGIDVATDSPQWTGSLPDVACLARRAARAAWLQAGDRERDAELSIVLADDALVRTLNRRYRNQDQSTNVLSFSAEDAAASGGPRLLGDVVLAFETVVLESRQQRKPFAHHLQHLCVHGVLHLLGHDHESEADAAAMERLEAAILASLNVPDPYVATVTERTA